jgi:hypothetical protein
VIALVDIPSADSCQMSSPERTVIGALAPGVGGIVVLCCWVSMGSVEGRWKCFQIGHVTDVDVWP